MAEDEPAGEPPPGEGPTRRRLPWPARIGPILHGLGVAWVIAGVSVAANTLLNVSIRGSPMDIGSLGLSSIDHG